MKQIDLKGLSAWHIDAIGAGLCLLLTLGLYTMSISPLRAEQDALDDRRLELKAHQAKADKLSMTRIAVGEQLAGVKASVAEVKLELLPASQINGRIAAVGDLAAALGLKIDSIQPGEAISGSRYEMVPMTLAGSGTYAKCLAFIHELRKALPDTGVSALELSGNPSERSGEKGSEARFRFELLWYAAPKLAS